MFPHQRVSTTKLLYFPDTLASMVSIVLGTLTQAIRNFAKSLEGWLSSSLQGYPSSFTSAKVLFIAIIIIYVIPPYS